MPYYIIRPVLLTIPCDGFVDEHAEDKQQYSTFHGSHVLKKGKIENKK